MHGDIARFIAKRQRAILPGSSMQAVGMVLLWRLEAVVLLGFKSHDILVALEPWLTFLLRWLCRNHPKGPST